MWNNLTVREETPDGTAWIQLIEDEPGKLNRIIFTIGKSGSSLNSYCFAIAELATKLLEQGIDLEDLMEMLFDITSSTTPRLIKGSRSGPEALAVAIRKYIQSLPTDVPVRISRFKSPTRKDNYPERAEA